MIRPPRLRPRLRPSPRPSRSKRPLLAVLALAALAAPVVVASPALADPDSEPLVLISELAAAGPGGASDDFIEITNYGDAPADLNGWRINRCAATGSKVHIPQVAPLAGVVLAPGDSYLIANRASTIPDADAYYDVSLANGGFGAWLDNADIEHVDSVAVYAAGVDSECGLLKGEAPLRNNLDDARSQSWQRVGHTGDTSADFIKAARTPGLPNATTPDPGVQSGDVLITELTNGGPAGGGDEFVEFANFGAQPVDISGWKFYRCQGDGRRYQTTLQAQIPAGTVLASGQVFVAAHTSTVVPPGVPHVRYATGVADTGFGALLEDASGVVRESVAVYETELVHQPPADSPCIQGEALPNRLDFGFDQTYQRFQSTGDNAADFVKAHRTIGELTIPDPDADIDPEPVETGVAVTELVHSGPAGAVDNYFELANLGDEPVSLAGWSVYRCQAEGRRNTGVQIPVIGDVTLAPGETYLAVRSGSPLHQAGTYDAVYTSSFATTGFGVMVFDAEGRVADSVGVYIESYSACTEGLSAVSRADVAGGESWQRFQDTGNNARDVVLAARSPGTLPELRAPADYTDAELAPVDVAPGARPLPSEQLDAVTGEGTATLSARAEHSTGETVGLTFQGAERISVNGHATRMYRGESDATPPSTRETPGETRVRGPLPSGGGDPVVAESTEKFPFQRFQLVSERSLAASFEVAWSGRSLGHHELQMYAWNHTAGVWDLLAAGTGVDGGPITLVGVVDKALYARGRVVDVLVQDGRPTQSGFSDDAAEPNDAFKDTAEYDFSLAYITDTQHLTESFRERYAEMTRWIATNAEARNIEYTLHTGDVVERWIHGHQGEDRARDEFAYAAEAMDILDEAGVPYGLLPGNHDNKWGRENELYKEYFPTSRFEDKPWYGGSWKEDDYTNHYDEIEVGGAKFLFVQLAYYTDDSAIDWANDVIRAHPDHNVVFATHEYLWENGELANKENARWTATGERYFDEIIAPNDNVVLAMGGHVHATLFSVKHDVGGTPGRTVAEMVANYQNFERAGGLFSVDIVRLLQMNLATKQVAVNSFSPSEQEHGGWRYDPLGRYGPADDEFTFTLDLNDIYDKKVETEFIGLQSASTVIGTVTAAAGEVATVDWAGLRDRHRYTWYVLTTSADGRTVLSPVSAFKADGEHAAV